MTKQEVMAQFPGFGREGEITAGRVKPAGAFIRDSLGIRFMGLLGNRTWGHYWL